MSESNANNHELGLVQVSGLVVWHLVHSPLHSNLYRGISGKWAVSDQKWRFKYVHHTIIF